MLLLLLVAGSPVDEGYALALALEAELLVAALLAVGLGLWFLYQLESPRVAGLSLRAHDTPLVGLGGRAGTISYEVHCGAIWLEGYGEGGASVSGPQRLFFSKQRQ